MKLITCLCAILAVVSALPKEDLKPRPESLEKMYKIAIPCTQQFNVDPSYIHRVGDVTIPRDDATNKFLYCFAVNSGIVDKDGHMVADKLTGIMGDHPLAGEVRNAIGKCNEITKEDPVATTVAMHICYGETFPIRYIF